MCNIKINRLYTSFVIFFFVFFFDMGEILTRMKDVALKNTNDVVMM